MAGKYAVQISCTLNGVKQKFLLDTVKEHNVGLSSSLSSHPIAQGDYISDHMYKNQATVQFDGSFGLHSGTNLNMGTGSNRIATFQSVFETIREQGVVCEILKISNDNSSTSRFLKRTNMVLTSIDWIEKIESLDFSFQFTQIITSNAASNAESYVNNVDENLGSFDTSDEYLPSHNVSITSNFYSPIITYNAICSALTSSLININTRIKTLSTKIKTLGSKGLTALGVQNKQASLIIRCFSNYDLNYCDKIFSEGFVANLSSDKLASLFPDSEKMENNDIVRFAEYLYDIYNTINLLSNDILCYQCASSGEQKYSLLIDNIYYEFSFTRNNTNNSYYLSVRNTTADSKEFVTASSLCSAAPTNFSTCTEMNKLFKTKNYNVYLMKAKGTLENDLTNYFIVLSKILPTDFCSNLDSIIYGEK